jgi:hypothetical protein
MIKVFKFMLIFSIIFGLVNSKSASGSTGNLESIDFLINLTNLQLDLPIFTTLIILFISWYVNKNQQQKQLNDLVNNQNKILGKLNQLNELDNKFNNLDGIQRQIIKQVQENNQKITDSEISLREHLNKYQVSQSINYRSNADLYSNNDSYQQFSQQPDEYSLNPIAIVDNIPKFIETYNLDKNSLSVKVIATVAETQESLNQRRSGNSDTVTLENTTQKKYWIVEEDSNYYLIPHAKIKIDEYNIKTLESLFDCINFISEYSDFQFVQPAKVSQLYSESWQLEQKGKLEFS